MFGFRKVVAKVDVKSTEANNLISDRDEIEARLQKVEADIELLKKYIGFKGK